MSNPHEEPWPEHREEFEVVMVLAGKSEAGADIDDFKRVRVMASSSWAAQNDPKVVEVTTHRAFRTTKPGQMTQEEVAAKARKLGLENGPVDRVNL